MNVEIPHDANDFLRELVVTGGFASEEAAVAEAIRLLKSREQLRAEIASGLRQLDNGDWVDGDTLFDELDREIDAIEKSRSGDLASRTSH